MQHRRDTWTMHLRRTALRTGALALAASMMLAGCGSEDSAGSDEKEDKDHVFKGHKKALDSARGVADQLQEAAKRKKDSE